MTVNTLLRSMSATEFRRWQALLLLEGQVRDLIRGGTEPEVAHQMVWSPPVDDDDTTTTE
jgi:hypothetical protein